MVSLMPAKKQLDICGKCRFARPINGNDAAISCQRHPPKVTSVVNNQITSHWPLLGKDQWCGCFEAKK
jgi:hypothetical protein